MDLGSGVLKKISKVIYSFIFAEIRM